MMQEVEVLKTIQELICSFFSEEQFTLSYFDTKLIHYNYFFIIIQYIGKNILYLFYQICKIVQYYDAFLHNCCDFPYKKPSN